MSNVAKKALAVALASIVTAGGFAHRALSQATSNPQLSPFSKATEGTALPEGWTPLRFKGVAPARYTLVRDGERVVVRADANASGSGLVFRFEPPLAGARILRWRWKGETLPQGADMTQRVSDDAVARIYVLFRRPSEELTATQRFKEQALRTFFGEVPPHASLMYVWDNRAKVGASIANPYTDRVRNIVVESGSARLSQWLGYERDIEADYRAQFGEAPPPVAAVAVMTDADNTGSNAVAYFGDVTLSTK